MTWGQLFRSWVVAFWSALATLVSGNALAQNALFIPLPQNQLNDATPEQANRVRMLREKPTTGSLQLVRMNLDALAGDATIMAFTSSDSATVTRRKIVTRGADDFTWIGDVAPSGGQAILVVRDGDVTGTIHKGLEQYTITPVGGGVHAVAKVDFTKFPPDHPPPKPRAPGQRTEIRPENSQPAAETAATPKTNAATTGTRDVAADGVQVDVFVAYTTAARTAYAGNMPALAQLAVDDANNAYTNSNANVSLRLVGTLEVAYTESSFDQALTDLTNGTGVMAPIHTQRNSTGADLVSLLISLSDSCGLAYINSSTTTAFSTVSYDCAVSNHSFAHELGHNFGARHDTGTDSTNTPFAYGHGYIFGTSWRTIMSYPGPCGGCPRLQYFSNPSVTYLGNPMGTAATHDVARVHRERVSTIAAFRGGIATPSLSVSPATNITASGTQGGPFSPSSFQYQLSATTGSVNFSISGIPTWLTASFTSGTATTSPITVTFTVNSSANSLTPNTYNATISFTNTTNGQGNTTRTAALTVNGAAPSNDNFANATVIQVGQTLSGTNVSATKQSGEPVHNYEYTDFGGKSVWWKYTAATAGSTTVSTCGSKFDTVLAVYTGSAVNALTRIASNDQFCKDQSQLSFNAVAGTTYYIVVDGYNPSNAVAASGSITLTVTRGLFACEAVTGLSAFSPDGRKDIAWQNESGQIGVWLMNGAGILSASTVGTEPAGWRLVATGDLNGDGHADLLFRHISGAVGVWFLGGGTFLSAATIATVTNDWHVVGLADLNGDGNADIIWRNDSGAVGA